MLGTKWDMKTVLVFLVCTGVLLAIVATASKEHLESDNVGHTNLGVRDGGSQWKHFIRTLRRALDETS
ncbi:hypothetical protein WJX75_008668 [Coccomyxa subellipsoidea]|uniref:Uncharacterized protein n=1 Tax=Coccomyxa subellipsoidea TaxID=248742 RepID=A0ABR2Z6S0_9CHLO